MKIRALFKTPDVIENALEDENLSYKEKEEQIRLCEKWIKYGELVTVEFDTESMTATVIERGH